MERMISVFCLFLWVSILSSAQARNKTASPAQARYKAAERKFLHYEVEMGMSGEAFSAPVRSPSRYLRATNNQKKEIAAIAALANRDSHRPLFHRCRDSGEAYSAAYLIHKEHLIEQKTDYNLTWVNCEMGSFIMMNGRADPRKNRTGSVIQTLDVMDFSVIHLSAYERLLLRWQKSSPEVKEDRNNLDPVHISAEILKKYYLTLHPEVSYQLPKTPLVATTPEEVSKQLLKPTNKSPLPLDHDAHLRTVVVMPFLGSDMGAGHSKLANRQAYLAACFWSFFAQYPHVVAMVKSVKDRDYILHQSNLPFWDVVLLEGLPKSASLPVATVQTTKARIMNGTWSQFEFMFFTESDQILMMRIPDDIYAYLDLNRRHLMIPHRLMAYPVSVLKYFHKRTVDVSDFPSSTEASSTSTTTVMTPPRIEDGVLTSTFHPRSPYDWMDMQCCLPRQHCTERNDWRKVSNTSVPVVNIFGLQVPLGNSNFHSEMYRACVLRESTNHHECP